MSVEEKIELSDEQLSDEQLAIFYGGDIGVERGQKNSKGVSMFTPQSLEAKFLKDFEAVDGSRIPLEEKEAIKNYIRVLIQQFRDFQ